MWEVSSGDIKTCPFLGLTRETLRTGLDVPSKDQDYSPGAVFRFTFMFQLPSKGHLKVELEHMKVMSGT